MYLNKDLSLIVTVVAKGFSDVVMEAAKAAGAEGATIFNARGNGIHESDTVLGVSIQPEKEVLMIVVRKAIRKKVMREICKNAGLNEEGKGLCFSMPIDELGGVSHLADFVTNVKRKTTSTASRIAKKKPNATAKKPATTKTETVKQEEKTEETTTKTAKKEESAKVEDKK